MQFDLTRPNTGRVLDYWLGGTHHFEVDRKFGDQISSSFPASVQLATDARRLIRYVVEYFNSHGVTALIDFGSSLPTCDNTHLVARQINPEIRVVYSDIDPITVAYGLELVQGIPNVIFLQADAVQPRTVLDAPETLALLGGERRVGFIFLNLAHSLLDDQVKSLLQTLYDWAAPGSYLAMSLGSEHWITEPDLAAIRETYVRAKLGGYFRTPAELIDLLGPWRLTAEGVQPNTQWQIPHEGQITRVLAYAMIAYK